MTQIQNSTFLLPIHSSFQKSFILSVSLDVELSLVSYMQQAFQQCQMDVITVIPRYFHNSYGIIESEKFSHTQGNSHFPNVDSCCLLARPCLILRPHELQHARLTHLLYLWIYLWMGCLKHHGNCRERYNLLSLKRKFKRLRHL